MSDTIKLHYTISTEDFTRAGEASGDVFDILFLFRQKDGSLDRCDEADRRQLTVAIDRVKTKALLFFISCDKCLLPFACHHQ